MLQRTPEWFAARATMKLAAITLMKKLLLTGLAALLLATGTAYAYDESDEVLRERCENGATYWCPILDQRIEQRKRWIEANQSPYAEKDYIIDCQSYRWKWEDRSFGRRHGYKTLADACVTRNCRSNPPGLCDDGNWGPVPRALLEEQLRDLGRVPGKRYVKPSENCKVADPTGTPLNIRSRPNGKILFTLRNGTGVGAENLSDDQKWIEVFPLAGHNKDRKGWAYLDFLDCGEA